MIQLPILVCVVAVVAHVLGEWKRRPIQIALFKMVASSTLLWTAFELGALASIAGRWVLVGLAASWLGDALLLVPGQGRLFQRGIAAFLATHLCYIAAILQHSIGIPEATLGLIVAAATAFGVIRWLRPHLTGSFRFLVPGYTVAITLMLAAALAGSMSGAPIAIAIGGIFFITSDFLVARDRFIARSIANIAWALPLYFAGQLFLIWGIVAT